MTTIEERIESQARSVKARADSVRLPHDEKEQAASGDNIRLRTGTSALSQDKKDLETPARWSLAVLLDRLTLNEPGTGRSSRACGTLLDSRSVGRILERVKRPNGLKIEKMRVPIGAVGSSMKRGQM